MITTDSVDYHVLIQAVIQTKNLGGLICEVGTRAGGSLKLIIDTLAYLPPRPIVSVDPYGWIDYTFGEQTVKFDYTNTMRDICLRDIHDHLLNLNNGRDKNFVNVVFFTLEDTEFFQRFADGVPVYNGGEKTIYDKYSMVFLDGPHSFDAVKAEIDFFAPRMESGAVVVIDDFDLINNQEALNQHIALCGLSLTYKSPGRPDGSGVKTSYVKA
jgi:hypothetical protein